MESLNSLFTILYDKIDILLNLELWKRTSQFDEQWGGGGGQHNIQRDWGSIIRYGQKTKQ